MGMSTHIEALISDTDETYQKHLKVLVACREADIEYLPEETATYFDSLTPYENLEEEKLQLDIPMEEWGDDCRSGYEIKVSDIPKGAYKLRFYNCY